MLYVCYLSNIFIGITKVTEYLYSFILGVGSFTIVDGNKVRGEDVGNK